MAVTGDASSGGLRHMLIQTVPNLSLRLGLRTISSLVFDILPCPAIIRRCICIALESEDTKKIKRKGTQPERVSPPHPHQANPISFNAALMFSDTVGRTRLRSSPAPSSSRLPSCWRFLFVATKFKYVRLYLGPLGRATFKGGAGNHNISPVSGSRSKCLTAGGKKMS